MQLIHKKTGIITELRGRTLWVFVSPFCVCFVLILLNSILFLAVQGGGGCNTFKYMYVYFSYMFIGYRSIKQYMYVEHHVHRSSVHTLVVYFGYQQYTRCHITVRTCISHKDLKVNCTKTFEVFNCPLKNVDCNK